MNNYSIKRITIAFETSKDITELKDSDQFIQFNEDLACAYPDFLSVLNKDLHVHELPNLAYLVIYESTLWIPTSLLSDLEAEERMSKLEDRIKEIMTSFFKSSNIIYKEIKSL